MALAEREVYLDSAATTPCGEDAFSAVSHALLACFGNPSSLHHQGLSAERILSFARRRVSLAIGANENEIYFTSGATESNNLALLGAARAKRRRGSGLVCSALEHHSVLMPLRHLLEEGFTLSEAPAPGGGINPEAFAELVDESTVLASCSLINNETGAINDIPAIVKAVKAKNNNVLFHCDAVQALGKIPVSVKELGVDLLSISSHKIHGPKGAGALYIRQGVRIVPLMHGGQQESGLRPGTENLPDIAGFGIAAELAVRELQENQKKVQALRARFLKGFIKISGSGMNFDGEATPYICSIHILGQKSEVLLRYLSQLGVYVSSGSACVKGKRSHVLTAMGLSPKKIDSTLRVSFSHLLTEEDIDYAISCLNRAVQELLGTGSR